MATIDKKRKSTNTSPSHMGRVRNALRTAVWTSSVYLPALRPMKNAVSGLLRQLTRRPHESDFSLLASLGFNSDALMIDIGANHGQSIDSIRLFCPYQPIVAFEPNPRIAKELTRKYKTMPNLNIESVALSDHSGQMTLVIPTYYGMNFDWLASADPTEIASFSKPGHLLQQHILSFRPERLVREQVTVPVRTLDSYNFYPSFIKIDVQGHERAVIDGAMETIKRAQPILLIEAVQAYPGLMDLLVRLGYRVCAYNQGNLEWDHPGNPNSFFFPQKIN